MLDAKSAHATMSDDDEGEEDCNPSSDGSPPPLQKKDPAVSDVLKEQPRPRAASLVLQLAVPLLQHGEQPFSQPIPLYDPLGDFANQQQTRGAARMGGFEHRGTRLSVPADPLD